MSKAEWIQEKGKRRQKAHRDHIRSNRKTLPRRRRIDRRPAEISRENEE